MSITSDQVLASLAAAFDSQDELTAFVSMSKPMIERGKLEAELAALIEAQQTSRQTLEEEIQAIQTSSDAQIAEKRAAQQLDFDEKQGPINVKQAALNELIAQIQGLVGSV
jgi:uncharacterized coiled-coil DUF342 family protein